MLFNEHQSRLWNYMLNFLEDYRKGNLAYCDLVGALEGALDAGEFKDKELVRKWYDLWTPLEIWNVAKGNSVTIEDVNKDLSDMESFLKTYLGK